MRVGGELEDGEGSLQEQLLEHRVVLLRGHLDAQQAAAVATQLMALDAWGDEKVQLYLGSPAGSLAGELDAALTLMDTVAALGVPVEAIGTGTVAGPAVGVLAVAHRRFVTPHTILRLGMDAVSAEGTAGELLRLARWREEQQGRFAHLVAAAAGVPIGRVQADLRSGRLLDPEQAQQYGLIDDVWEAGGRGGTH